MDFVQLVIEWIIVFGINIIPAFAPPTWVVLAYFYIAHPQNLLLLILIGVTASTTGRYVLAISSRKVFTKFASEEKKEEMELIRNKLRKGTVKKFLFSMLFSLGPFPSNSLFIAVGTTRIRITEILAGFFVGRTISYLFLVFTSEKIYTSLEAAITGSASIGTLIIEIIGVIALLAFFLFDWKKLLLKDELSKKPKRRFEYAPK
ncbi:MAG: hypothetical protein GX950_02500 [Candidatus Diapherotrites archaeon]|jgi:membrane protein YqaA with SNARE-associated domain|uniref:VTT domain-containing protein n=1 Tax=Candidatus Iainarchaeum sp. TaxID=3101447 RepID=A0A7K4C003_9ARCH|nr:hypothetical protein [Candidatus Diapherotrites archaeon]